MFFLIVHVNNDCSWAKYLTPGDVANHLSISVWHGLNSTNQMDRRRALPPAEQSGKLIPNAQALPSLVVTHKPRQSLPEAPQQHRYRPIISVQVDAAIVSPNSIATSYKVFELTNPQTSEYIRSWDVVWFKVSDYFILPTISTWSYCRNWIISIFLLSCSFLLQISFGWCFFALLDLAWWLQGRCYQ